MEENALHLISSVLRDRRSEFNKWLDERVNASLADLESAIGRGAPDVVINATDRAFRDCLFVRSQLRLGRSAYIFADKHNMGPGIVALHVAAKVMNIPPAEERRLAAAVWG